MTLSAQLRSLTPRRHPSNRGALKPRLEYLEDRITPSLFTVTNPFDDGSAGTLRSAIAQANASGGANEIVFDPGVSGTITLNGSELFINDSSSGLKPFNLTITGPGADQLAVSGNHASRVFEINGNVASISGLTIENGLAGDYGGGILSQVGAALTVSDISFSGNSAGPTGSGGAIFGEGLSVSNSTFSGNCAGSGGAIFGEGLSVSNSTFSGNSAANDGGGIENVFSQVTVSASTFSGNSAGHDGGGIYVDTSTTLNIYNSTLAANSAGYDGGGIYFWGGIYSSNVPHRALTNVTFTANRCNSSGSAGTGGGICSDPSTQMPLTLNNTIVAGNFNGPTPGATPDDITGTLDSASAFNLIGTGGSGGLQDRSVDPVHNNQVDVADPGLGPLGDYGGPTLTIPLLAGSPAIAAGEKALLVDTTDQRGPGFPRTYQDTIDIGAFESQLAPPRVTFTVTTTNDSGPGSLRQCVQDNNLLGGGNTIVFALPAGGTITLSGGELLVIQDLTITSPGADKLAVSGNNASRVFEIAGATASLSGMTIENGLAGDYGGGILCDGDTGTSSQSSLSVSDISFSGNSAGPTGSGGAIFGDVTVSNSTFSGNSASEGGAIFGAATVSDSTFSGNSASEGGAIFSIPGVWVSNSTFSDNSASNGGGAIEVPSANQLSVAGSTFTCNSAGNGDGGGIESWGNEATISGSTFAGNRAGLRGGGFCNEVYGGSLTVSNSTFAGNCAGGNGGGVADFSILQSGYLTVSNSTFAGNSSATNGGGIYSTAEQGTLLVNVTIADNSAEFGGGIAVGFAGILRLSNTIVARNTATVSGPDITGRAVSNGHNLVGDVSGGLFHAVLGAVDQVGTADNPIDPLLAPLGNYGGPTQTMPLLPGSPAIDAGGNALALVPTHRSPFTTNPLTTDQRGTGFDRVVNGTVDIGAYENHDQDGDGVDDALENAGPNGGDGTGDGIPDSQQANVASWPNAVDGSYVTLQSPAGTSLVKVQTATNPPPGLPANAQTPVGQIGFQVQGVASGGTTTVTLYMPTGVKVNQYWEFGPNGWFNFTWDGQTGAQFRDVNGDGTKDIVLTFVDGQRGDNDGIANGVIVERGFPVLNESATFVPGSSGIGGTTIVSDTLDADPNATYTLQFSADLLGSGQGPVSIGSFSVSTDGTGAASFSAAFSTDDLTGQAITATATDSSGNTSVFAQDVPVADGSSLSNIALVVGTTPLQVQANLQDVVTLLQNNGSSTTLPSLLLQPFSTTDVQNFVGAINALAPASDPNASTVTVVLDLGGQTYQTDTSLNVPSGIDVVIQNGTLIGGSPAMTVDGGSVSLIGVTALNDTNAPTIVVNGGALTIRNSKIEESGGSTQAAISITAGSVDLGTDSDPGGNTINVNGSGEFVHNTTGSPVPDTGNIYSIDGTPQAGSELSFTSLAVPATSSVYGQPVTFTATVAADFPGDSTPTGTVSFIDATTGTALGSVSLTGASASLSTTALGIGTHEVIAGYSGDSSYVSSLDRSVQTVHKATPALTVNSASLPFDGMSHAAGFTITGVNNDDLSGLVSVTYTDSQHNVATAAPIHADTYLVTASFPGNANYLPVTATGTLTITPAAISYTISNDSHAYGNTANLAADLPATFNTGIKGQNLAISYRSTGNTTTTRVGTYDITGVVSDGTGPASDYSVTLTNGTLTVTKANAVIVVTPYSVTYNGAAHTATGTAKGVLNESLSGLDLSGTTHTNAGDYPADAWTFTDVTGNYNNASGTVSDSVSKAGLAITANSAIKLFGTPNPTFSVAYAGFVNSETSISLGGTLTFTTPATISSPVGTYTVTPGGLTSTNYATTFVPGTLTITINPGSAYVLNSSLGGAVTISGNATIKLPGDLVVDSSSTSAILASGNASITAMSVQVGGGVSTRGNASVTKTGTPGATGDPLSRLPAPTVPGYGTPISESLAGNSTATISQGAYSRIVVSGNASLTLNPGVYVVGTGGVAVSGNGSLICNGVTFIIQGGGFAVSGNAGITGSNVLIYNAASGSSMGGITLSGNGTFKLNAATTGPDANILIDQRASNTRALNISGNAMLGITGTIHAPSALLTMSGNGSLQNPLIVDSLNLSGNVALTQMAAGSDGAGDAMGIANTLLAGNLNVYISDPAGFFTSDMLARIQDTINAWDALLVPYNVTISEVSDPTLANLVVDDGTTSASGDMSNGVLGCYNPTASPTEITLIQGWNWYTGADATQIGSDQYDFQTTVSHELGHALGLGGSDSLTSPMNETLPTGAARRVMTVADLNIPYPPDGADPLTAAGFRFVTAPGALAQNGFATALSSGTNLSTVGVMALPSAGGTAASAGQAGALLNAPSFAQASTNQSSGQLSVVSGQWPAESGQWSVASGQVNAQAGSGEWGASEGRRTEGGGWRKDRSPIPSGISLPSSALPKWEVLDSVLDELASDPEVRGAGCGVRGVPGTITVLTLRLAGVADPAVPTDSMPRQNRTQKSAGARTWLTDILLAAGFCGSGAGMLAARKRRPKSLSDQRGFLKFGPRI